jgi:large subunit ribosomal protein L4
MKTTVYDINAQKLREIELPKSVFGAKTSEDAISLAIRVYLAHQRRSHAKVKTRSEVAGTTKKMWSQKGTGRARHGSAKAPIFVGGGVTHGPRGDRSYSLKINKKIKKIAITSVLSKFAQGKGLVLVDKLSTIAPKTKEAAKLVAGLMADNKVLSSSKKIGLITTRTLANPKRAFSNLPYIKLMPLTSLNVYDLSNQNFLILTPKVIQNLVKKYGSN